MMDAPVETHLQASDLKQYLSHVSADRVSLSRRLFASQRVLNTTANSGAVVFNIFGAKRPDEGRFVEICGHRQTMSVVVTNKPICDQLGGRVWSDFQGESRLLAWCLSHDRLLEGLQAIFEQPLLPKQIRENLHTNQNSAEVVTVGFTMSSDTAAVSFEGVMCLPLPWAKRLTISSMVHVAELSRHKLGRLPIVMSLQIPGPHLALPRLRYISAGDTIVLGSSTAVLNRVELRFGNKTWFRAGIHQSELRITSPRFRDIQSQPEECEVNVDNIDLADTNIEDEGAGVPIALQFDIGALTLTFDEASKLQPGYIFTLPEPVTGTNVRIRANGTLIGRGELVIVGDTLGVSVTSWSDNGLQ